MAAFGQKRKLTATKNPAPSGVFILTIPTLIHRNSILSGGVNAGIGKDVSARKAVPNMPVAFSHSSHRRDWKVAF
jgi:hypothetical protein